MAQQPAVVIIARHGLRLDAADPSWHLSTPSPYDPPLTYGGWSQCRSLGIRIANLLHARELELNGSREAHGATSHDAGQPSESGERPTKRRRVKHKVIIHSSPFLRCLQTSVAISAGMAQYNPTIEQAEKAKTTTTSKLHSASPRLHATPAHGTPSLGSSFESKHHDLHHTLARKQLHEHRRYRKSTVRVDAFLGEWLNPEYYDQITPPPPSPMMMTTAKAELMENETVEIFTPAASTKSASSSLWGGATGSSHGSRESTLDDWSPVEEALPPSPTSPSRSRASTVQSTSSSNDRKKSPFRPGAALQPLTSTLPKQETAVYHPPQPHYAVSTSDHIPRGYFTHARNACTDVDYQWDSSRPPQNWGDGGEFGEGWSAMHKRFRRGLNHVIQWYSEHNANERAEDALGLEQADRHSSHNAEEEEREDLVVIMVTHGAGCNALIGAMTGQPVLLDVGMASLSMAVRKDDAPSLASHASSTVGSANGSLSHRPSSEQIWLNGLPRRASMDLGLSAIYDMRIVASSEHLRPGADPSRANSPALRPVDSLTSHYRQRLGIFQEPARSSTSSALGTIRRPSALNTAAAERSSSIPPNARLEVPPTPPLSTGLWTPPAGRTPELRPQVHSLERLKEEGVRPILFSSLSHNDAVSTSDPCDDMVLDFSNTPSNSRPSTSGGDSERPAPPIPNGAGQIDGMSEAEHTGESDKVAELPKSSDKLPEALSRGLIQKGLWGVIPSGTKPERRGREAPKRRWTVDRE